MHNRQKQRQKQCWTGKREWVPFCSLWIAFFHFSQQAWAISLENGEKVFHMHCSVCHIGGNNVIIPEKNLKKEALEANGMNHVKAISYQVMNGKNGMPAFGGRLTEPDIDDVATYVLQKGNKNFEE
jgi:cytochrome c6